MKLQNKVAIITGGGKGIGAEISLRLAKEGAKIVIAEKDIESAENIKKKIIENKGDAIVVDTNVANEDSVNQMAEAAIKKIEAEAHSSGLTEKISEFLKKECK